MKKLFWAKEGLRITLAIFAATAVYTFLMGSMDQKAGKELLTIACMYLAVMSAAIALATGIGIYQTLIPLTLGFNAPRRSVIAGIQIYRLMTLIPVVAVCTILAAVGERFFMTVTWTYPVLVTAALLFCNALGGVMGILSTKFGKGIQIALAVVLSILCFAIMMVAVIVGLEFATQFHWIIWIILGIGSAVYAVCTLFEVRTIRRFCVR